MSSCSGAASCIPLYPVTYFFNLPPVFCHSSSLPLFLFILFLCSAYPFSTWKHGLQVLRCSNLVYYSAPDREWSIIIIIKGIYIAQVRKGHKCIVMTTYLSVCLKAYLQNYMSDLHQFFVNVTYVCGSVLSDSYRAMLCIRGTSHGPVSFCPSQVGVLLKRRITQIAPHDSPGTLVF